MRLLIISWTQHRKKDLIAGLHESLLATVKIVLSRYSQATISVLKGTLGRKHKKEPATKKKV